jgi:hypothetical protein
MTEKRTIRSYCTEETNMRDEGGYYKMVEVEDLPRKLKARMGRCGGCHDDFYNDRHNSTCNHCWSLKDDSNFRSKGRPNCYH